MNYIDEYALNSYRKLVAVQYEVIKTLIAIIKFYNVPCSLDLDAVLEVCSK